MMIRPRWSLILTVTALALLGRGAAAQSDTLQDLGTLGGTVTNVSRVVRDARASVRGVQQILGRTITAGAAHEVVDEFAQRNFAWTDRIKLLFQDPANPLV